MNAWLEGLLTILITTAMCAVTMLLLNLVLGAPLASVWVALAGAVFGLAYGLQSGILRIYDLTAASGWVALVLDMT